MSQDGGASNSIFFGRDLSKIPCFRNTFLYSISSGIGSGLAFFMFTSKTQQATRFGLGVYCMVTMGYWSYCRYNYSVMKFESGALRKALEAQARLEGVVDSKGEDC